MSHEHKGNPVATYIITALILGVITYFEFALVEYDFAWLSRAATIFWLVALSLIKFVMVVAIFMHLKDDEKTYTGFFGSGMILALATFVILPLLFTVSSFPQSAVAQAAGEAEAEAGGHADPATHADAPDPLEAEVRDLIETDGYSRSAAAILDSPRPKDRSLKVEPPAAPEVQATLSQAPAGDSAAAQAAGQEQPEQPAADQEAAAEAEAQVAGAQQEQPEQQAAVEFDRELGESTYASICSGCHGAQGAGIPGVFPPLADHLPEVYNAGGREYLIDVVLHGLSGPIEVNGQTYNGAMPAWAGSLTDEQVAAVLNHALTAWGNEAALEEFTPITADEAAQNRAEDPGNLNERRAELLGQ